LAVSAVVVWAALLTNPGYTATTLVELSPQSSGSRYIGGFAPPSNADVEMAYMHSTQVIEDALDAGASRLAPLVEEEAAHRRLDEVLRLLGGKSPACILEAIADPLPDGEKPREYRLRFRPDGRDLSVATGDGPFQPVPEYGWDREIRVGDSRVTLRRVEGEPGGRTFRLVLRSRRDTRDTIREGLVTRPRPGSLALIELGFTADDPGVAQRTTEALAQSYRAYRRTREQTDLQSALGIIQTQIGEMQKSLEGLEQARDAYRDEKKATHMGEKTIALIGARNEIEGKILELASQKEGLDLDRTKFAEVLKRPFDEQVKLLNDANVLRAAAEHRDASNSLEERRLKSGEKDIETERLQFLADRARRGLEEAVAFHVRTRLQGFEDAEADIARRLDKYKIRRAEVDRELLAFPEIQRELERQQREIDALRTHLGLLMAKKVDLGIQSRSPQRPVELIEEGVLLPDRKASWLKPLLVAIFLGLASGIGAALGAEALGRGVRTTDAIEDALGLPVFAAVPDFRTLPRAERRVLTGALPAFEVPRSAAAEAYRRLGSQLRFSTAASGRRVLAIVSPSVQEGKTVTTLNVAITLARAGSRVVVVDADLRRATAHRHLGLSLKPGLADILENDLPWRDAVQATQVPGLSFIAAGQPHEDPGILLHSPAVGAMVQALRAEFDYVLLDAPPLLVVSDSTAFVHQLDGVLLLARWKRTSLDVIRAARRQLDEVGGRVLGSVLNAYDSRSGDPRDYRHVGTYGYDTRSDEEESRPPSREGRAGVASSKG
jgi:capsular exopolysaccharide synthesis family protein